MLNPRLSLSVAFLPSFLIPSIVIFKVFLPSSKDNKMVSYVPAIGLKDDEISTPFNTASKVTSRFCSSSVRTCIENDYDCTFLAQRYT